MLVLAGVGVGSLEIPNCSEWNQCEQDLVYFRNLFRISFVVLGRSRYFSELWFPQLKKLTSAGLLGGFGRNPWHVPCTLSGALITCV